MSIKFIHVGMMKTATTYMQNVWLRDRQFALAFQGVVPVVQYLRQSTLDNTFDPTHSMTIQVDRQPMDSPDIIVSQEGFTCGYLTDLEERPIRELICNAGQLLGTLNSQTDNILICVRSPSVWLRSMHAQFINEGQFGDGARFLAHKEQFLRDALDLGFMVDCYRQHFGNVVVLPFEYLSEDEEVFWGILKEKFDVSVPAERVGRINESVSGIRLPLMSGLNEISYGIRDSLIASKDYTNQERDILVQNSASNDRWLNRRFCQYGTDEEIHQMCERLAIKDDLAEFRRLPISASFAQCVEERFISPFEAVTGDKGLAEQYRRELWQEVGQ